MKKAMDLLSIIFVLFVGYLAGQFGHFEKAVQAKTDAVIHDVLKAKRIEIVDNKGNLRGVFAVRENGNPRISLYDNRDGKIRGSFSIDKDGSPNMVLCDINGTIRGKFGLNKNGSPILCLLDAAGKFKSLLTVREGSPMICFFGQNNDPRCGLALRKGGAPILEIINASGTTVGTFGMGSEGTVGAVFNDSKGKPRCILGVNDKDCPGFSLFDTTGKIVSSLP